MKFDDNGNLQPYEIIKTDFESIQQVFVEEMPFSATRKDIFENLKEYNQKLKLLIKNDFKQWINGSFVTQKRNPSDIDIITFVDFTIYENNESEFEKLRQWRFDKSKRIDGYFIKIYPTEHPKHKFYQFDCHEWAFQFHRIKQSKNVKGFLEITI